MMRAWRGQWARNEVVISMESEWWQDVFIRHDYQVQMMSGPARRYFFKRVELQAILGT